MARFGSLACLHAADLGEMTALCVNVKDRYLAHTLQSALCRYRQVLSCVVLHDLVRMGNVAGTAVAVEKTDILNVAKAAVGIARQNSYAACL